MKTLIIFILVSCSAWAQEDLEKALETNLKNEEAYAAITAREKKALDDAEKRLLDRKEEFMILQDSYANRDNAKSKTIMEINSVIDSFSFFQKMGGKAGFYKCLRTSLESANFMDHARCSREHTPKLSEDEQRVFNKWKTAVGRSPGDMKKQLDQLPQDIDRLESMLPTYKANLRSAEMREESVKSNTKVIRRKIHEKSFVSQYTQYLNCNEETPNISLEEKTPFPGAGFEGPFVGVPRDNQDGLGTCFANASKNLLVGLSKGKDVASFTDLALQYKASNGSLLSSGLDGGISCSALNELRNKGYCPQTYSPLENGDRNLIGETLFKQDPYSYLSYNVNLLKNFVNGVETFKNDGGNSDILHKAKFIIDKIKSNPNIIIPLPVARFNIPDQWKVREAYSLNKSKINISEADFLQEYQKEYQKFYPHYVKALIEGKNLDQIFDIYKREMDPFIQKYNISQSLPEYKRVFLIDAKKDFNDPQFKTKLRASLEFLKEILGFKGESDDKVIEYCNSSGFNELKFMNTFQPLLTELKKNNFNSDLLFDKEGKLKSSYELMQLVVAPACLDPDKRVKFDFEYSCNDGYDTVSAIKNSKMTQNEKVLAIRERVVMSLVQGYPLGNSFPTSESSAHINTIVGLRFNKQNKQCEYLIRESQTGRSEWLGESGLFNKMQALTEVRRE